MTRPILEREQELAELGLAAREALAGAGSIVLIEGEAGIGKSSLVNAIRSVLPAEGRLLTGWCDDLATPRVLGPLRDLRDQVGRELVAALDSGDRARVTEALRSELSWSGHATVLVVEDVHWADEATLDVLRFLVRRVDSLPVALVLTYRDELAADHPLKQLLGLAVRAPRVRRLHLAGLSLAAVRRLGSMSAVDAEAVFAMTAGNPFLVAEVLASGDLGRVPPSVAEAVGARLSALDGDVRAAVERLSVIPSSAERWLVDAVVPGGLAALGPAEERGVLQVSATRVGFRHELTRRAVADSLPAVRRVACNQAVLTALLARYAQRAHAVGDGVDLSRILHHAAEVADEATIVQYGPLAQQDAVAAGSHREAVAYGRLTLAYRAALPAAELVSTLERHAIECYTVGLGEEAVRAMEQSVALRRDAGVPVTLGYDLRWLSRIAWWAGDRRRAEETAREAIAVLAEAGDERALALAMSNQSQLHALAGRRDEAIEMGERAVTMARSLGEADLLSHALANVGMALWDGDPAGRRLLQESLRIARDAGQVEHACRAAVSLAWRLIHELQLDEALAVASEAISFAEATEFDGFLQYLHVSRGMALIARGAWAEAERSAELGLAAAPPTRCAALTVVGRVRARRGDPGADELLGDALTIAERVGEAQRLGPAAAALLEAGWLTGNSSMLASAADRGLAHHDEVRRRGAGAFAADLVYWLRVAGHDVPLVEVDHPYAHLAAGRWREAAAAWERAGCPYERALALSHSQSSTDLLLALSIVDSIGAAPLGRILRERLRRLGVSRVPRGRLSSTRGNPAGLTERQVQVLRLLAAGLSNAEIASQLVLSVRTVDTHVAAILSKLEAPTRRHAARRAVELGVVDPAPS